MKICKKCLIKKDLIYFGKNKNNIDGVSIYCKECEKKRADYYRNNNRKKVNNSSKNWRIKNPEKYKQVIKKYLEKNPNMTSKERLRSKRNDPSYLELEKERRKKYVLKNIEKIRENRKIYYYSNKKKERKKNDEWRKNKMKIDGFFRMKRRLRDRIRDYMKGKNIGKKTKEIIGLDYEEFKNYISSKFTEGMTWENYGEWHLDHIIPLCEAKNEEELFRLNNYKNLQPLWAKDNLKKNRKYDN